MRITPLPKGRPDAIKRKKVIVKAKPSITSGTSSTSRTSGTDTAGTSTTGTRGDDRNKANTQANSGANR